MAKSKNRKAKKPGRLHQTLVQAAGVFKHMKISPRSNNKYTSAIAKAERLAVALDEYLQIGFSKLQEAKLRELQAFLHNSFTPSEDAIDIWRLRAEEAKSIRAKFLDVIQQRKRDSSALAQLKANDLKLSKQLQRNAEEIRAARHRLAECEDAVDRHTRVLGMYGTPISPATVKIETDYITKHADEAESLLAVLEVLAGSRQQLIAETRRASHEDDDREAEISVPSLSGKMVVLADIDRLFQFWKWLCEHAEQAKQFVERRAKYDKVEHLLKDFEEGSASCRRDLKHILLLQEQVKEDIRVDIGRLYGKDYIWAENRKRIVEIHDALNKQSSGLTPVGRLQDGPSSEPEINSAVERPQVAVSYSVQGALIAVQSYLGRPSTIKIENYAAKLNKQAQILEELNKQLAVHGGKWQKEENSNVALIEEEEELIENSGSDNVQPGSRLFELRAARLESHAANERVFKDLRAKINAVSKLKRNFDVLLRYYQLRDTRTKLVRDLLLSVQTRNERLAEEDMQHVNSIYSNWRWTIKRASQWTAICQKYPDVEHPAHDELMSELAEFVEEWENRDDTNTSLPVLATLSGLEIQELDKLVGEAMETDTVYGEYQV